MSIEEADGKGQMSIIRGAHQILQEIYVPAQFEPEDEPGVDLSHLMLFIVCVGQVTIMIVLIRQLRRID